MTGAACLLSYGLVTAVLAPRLLVAQSLVGRAPRLCVAGWFVVKSLLDYVSRHGFALFAWWRIIVGVLGLIGLALVG